VIATAPINPNAITMAIITLDLVVRASFERATMFFSKVKVFYIRISIIGSLIREFSSLTLIMEKNIRYYLQNLVSNNLQKKRINPVILDMLRW
jgi:hypothetical protein